MKDILEHCYSITESYLNISAQVAGNFPVIDETQRKIQETKSIFLEQILPVWNPIDGNISISYNGGKDCQVLLIIYLACLYEFFYIFQKTSQKSSITNVRAVYIKQSETFHILENFVDSSSTEYGLELYKTQVGNGMKSALQEYLDYLDTLHKINDMQETSVGTSSSYGVIIGIRRSDPYALNLREIQETDNDWPSFTRLQPLLDWNLGNVWSFLLYSGEPFCKLYELGYTSIGGIHNTLKNPKLNKQLKGNTRWNHFQWEESNSYGGKYDTDNTEKPAQKLHGQQLVQSDLDHDLVCQDTSYYPGWYLIADDQERLGRV